MSDKSSSRRPWYFINLAPSHDVGVKWIPGSVFPVTLSLSTKDHSSLGRALEEPGQEANLVIGMDRESALRIFAGIRDLARKLDWSLPKEDDNPV
jgi:hypothetical protein